MKGIGLRIQNDPIIAFTADGLKIKPISHGKYKYLVFKLSGIMIVKTPTVVDYMLLGGGGSGGCQQNDACAGGGGAGGLISGNTIINSGSYNTVVGEGGVGKTTTGYGNNGNDSTILSLGLIAIGGGGGGYHGYDGKNGGCGGGAGSRFETGLYYNPGIGSQGKNGGTGSSAAGGGGGLTSNGGNSRYYSSVQGYGGNGGSGSSFNDIWPEISGTDLGFSFNRFGGGGGGTGYRNRHGSGVDGGTNGVYRATGINALPNTGAGSGGGHGVATGQLPAGKSGNGGSGFVIIRFPILNILVKFVKYIRRVLFGTPTGTFPKNNLVTPKDIYVVNSDLNLLNDTLVLWCGLLGSITSSNKITYAFSADDNNRDCEQSNAAYQPYFAGTIAPNLRRAIFRTSKAGSNTRAYLSHSVITYKNNLDFTFAFILNWNGFHTDLVNKRVQITNAPISNSFFLNTNNTYSVVNLDATNPPTGSINFSAKTKPYSTIIGKQTIFHYVKLGNTHKVYRDGVLDGTGSGELGFKFSQFPNGYQGNGDLWCFGGRFHYYQIISRALSANLVANHYVGLAPFYPEIESVQISNKNWATSNLDITTDIGSNVFNNITNSIWTQINPHINWWHIDSSLLPTISGTEIYMTKSVTAGSYIGVPYIFTSDNSKTYKWFRLTFQAKSSMVTNSIQINKTAWTFIPIKNPALSLIYQDYEFIMKYKAGYGMILGHTTIPDTGSSIALNNITLSQAGWSNMDLLYNILRISGSYNHLNAISACSAWCYYNNDPDTYALYGKIYNKYAKMLIEQYPPTASGYTYNIPYLDGYGSYELYTSGSRVIKANNANYWKTNSGSNTTGLSLIGTGYRKADGTFALATLSAYLWTRNTDNNGNPVSSYTASNKALQVLHNSETLSYTYNATNLGYAIRLVNNDSISVQHSPDMILILQPDLSTGYSISVPIYRVPIGYKAYIDWDDGVIDLIPLYMGTTARWFSHTYSSVPATYSVRIGGKISLFNIRSIWNTGSNMLVEAKSLGNALSNTSLAYAFYGCKKLTEVSSILPNTVTSLEETFWNCFIFNSPNVCNWDTSKVTNMAYMFRGATAFNQDISNWNVSSCSNFNNMFHIAYAFNQDIGNWKLRPAGVTMTDMFYNASAWSTPSALKTLIGWANYVSSSWNGKSSGTPSSIALDISPRVLTDNVYNVHPYTDSGVVIPFTNSKEAKNYLVSQGWTITTG